MKDDAMERELEKLTAKIIKEETLVSPSSDFTDRIMSQIKIAEHAPTVYVPLISKMGWAIIGGIFFVFLALFFLSETVSTDNIWVDTIEIPQVHLPNVLVNLFKIPVLDTLVYGILAFTLFLYIQIFVLKRYFDSRL